MIRIKMARRSGHYEQIIATWGRCTRMALTILTTRWHLRLSMNNFLQCLLRMMVQSCHTWVYQDIPWCSTGFCTRASIISYIHKWYCTGIKFHLSPICSEPCKMTCNYGRRKWKMSYKCIVNFPIYANYTLHGSLLNI